VTKDRSPSIYDDVWFQQEDLFINGKKGYHTYRIPTLIVSRKGTILALKEQSSLFARAGNTVVAMLGKLTLY